MTITAAATFSATLVDEWARRGIHKAFVAPGSRSTPLLLALDADDRIDVHIFHDERAASYAALGFGAATGIPAIVLCTSGTATTHLHGAVVEADLSAVPLIVCTADRPPELWNRGAPQTIGQTRLYGKVVRLFIQPGPAKESKAPTWRPLAADVADHAIGHRGARPGPVHANLSFRDPLVGDPGPLPPEIAPPPATARPSLAASTAERIASLCDGTEGVIVAGRGVSDPSAVQRLGRTLGWPVIADHQSGARADDTIAHADALLRCPAFADDERPAVVLRFGEALSSKSLSGWITSVAADGAEIVALHQPGRLIDPEDIATVVDAEAQAAGRLADDLAGCPVAPTAQRWLEADRRAREAVWSTADPRADTEMAVAVRAAHSVDAGGIVVAASSMPIRYLEWFDSGAAPARVLANRGANGIDGVISTAIGVALTGRPTVCLLGDIAFLHDSSALAALHTRAVDLTIVVLDNDGGGIFSFLPQADVLSAERFDRLFGTPHGTDLVALASAHGLPATDDTSDLAPRGVRVVVARTPSRRDNVELVRAVNRAVAATVA